MNATLEHGTATPETDTRQTLELDSKAGKKILRTIVKDAEQWRGIANASTQWRLELTRTIPGAIGEPDVKVRIVTDLELKPRGEREISQEINGKTYSIRIPECRRIWLDSYYLPTFFQLLLDGWRIGAEYTYGSQNTIMNGLGYMVLFAYRPDSYYRRATISQTEFLNGKQLSCGGMES